MAKLLQIAIAQYATLAGFKDAATASAIAMAESGGNPRAHNGNAGTGDDSYGLWQINMLGSMGPSRRKSFGITSNEQLYNPMTNAKAAKKIYDGQGWNAWSVYKSGAYKKYMPSKSDSNWTDGALSVLDNTLLGAPGAALGLLDGSGGVLGAVDSTIDTGTAISDGINVVKDAATWITNPSNWVRVLYVIGGAALVIGGITIMARPLVNSASGMLPTGKLAKAVT